MIGIFSLDPGPHSGVTWGVYSLDEPLVKDAMRSRIDSGSKTLTGSEWEQIDQLVEMWDQFTFACQQQKLPQPELVIEDFSLVPGLHKPGKEGISPIRYSWGFVGYLAGRDHTRLKPIWQLPSYAMRYNNRETLTSWDAWIRGKEHERAAFAHVGLRLMTLYARQSVRKSA